MSLYITTPATANTRAILNVTINHPSGNINSTAYMTVTGSNNLCWGKYKIASITRTMASTAYTNAGDLKVARVSSNVGASTGELSSGSTIWYEDNINIAGVPRNAGCSCKTLQSIATANALGTTYTKYINPTTNISADANFYAKTYTLTGYKYSQDAYTDEGNARYSPYSGVLSIKRTASAVGASATTLITISNGSGTGTSSALYYGDTINGSTSSQCAGVSSVSYSNGVSSGAMTFNANYSWYYKRVMINLFACAEKYSSWITRNTMFANLAGTAFNDGVYLYYYDYGNYTVVSTNTTYRACNGTYLPKGMSIAVNDNSSKSKSNSLNTSIVVQTRGGTGAIDSSSGVGIGTASTGLRPLVSMSMNANGQSSNNYYLIYSTLGLGGWGVLYSGSTAYTASTGGGSSATWAMPGSTVGYSTANTNMYISGSFKFRQTSAASCNTQSASGNAPITITTKAGVTTVYIKVGTSGASTLSYQYNGNTKANTRQFTLTGLKVYTT